VAGDTGLHWRFSGWGVETTLEIYCLGSGDDTGDSGWGYETTLKTQRIGDNSGDLAAGKWR